MCLLLAFFGDLEMSAGQPIANTNQPQEANASKLDQLDNGITALVTPVSNLGRQLQETGSGNANLKQCLRN